MKTNLLTFLVVFTLFVTTSCNNDDDSSSPATSTLSLDLNGLENLGDDYVYEGWIMVNGSPVTTGTFSVNDAGELSATTFQVNSSDLEAATMFVLTIEPAVGDDPAPSDVKILSGAFTANTASIDATAEVGNFSSAAGRYFLATPTSASTDDNYAGVWFGNPDAGQLLTLPDLSNNPGWTYEGWVVMTGDDGTTMIPVSTGTFDNPAVADDNAMTSMFKGTDGDGPPFPGEDFIMNAPAGLTFPRDIRGSNLVISIEPVPDNDPAPFTFKPLATQIDAMQALGGTNIADMTRDLANFPTGTVTR